jgi:hypothetical protein
MQVDDSVAIDDTRQWVRRAVIGLNLCPFAKSVDVKDQVRYVVSHAQGVQALLEDLERELTVLHTSDPATHDTTLLIATRGFAEFLEFNDLLAYADRTLSSLGFEGLYQIASLHPQYQFAGTDEDDITNFTNRSPYPTLHLLREASIDRAVQAFPHAEAIFETNMRTMEKLGLAGWQALQVGPSGQDKDVP